MGGPNAYSTPAKEDAIEKGSKAEEVTTDPAENVTDTKDELVKASPEPATEAEGKE